MGIFDFGKSSRQQGEEDGAKGENDSVKYVLDKDYQKGHDHGKGLHAGQEATKSLWHALDPGGSLDKVGKSEEFGRGWDQGAGHGEKYQPSTSEEQPTERTSSYSGGSSSYGGSSYSYGYHAGTTKGITTGKAFWLLFAILVILVLALVKFSPAIKLGANKLKAIGNNPSKIALEPVPAFQLPNGDMIYLKLSKERNCYLPLRLHKGTWWPLTDSETFIYLKGEIPQGEFKSMIKNLCH